MRIYRTQTIHRIRSGQRPLSSLSIQASDVMFAFLLCTGGSRLLCSVGVIQYRDAIPLVLREGSKVLEIGCHFGVTTAQIKKQCKDGEVIGVDISKKIIANARTKFPEVRFEVSLSHCPNI